jgi:hypothetical protein
MKLLLSLLFVSSTLFAGGDLLPVPVSKYENIQVKASPAPRAPQRGCYKPNIQKCPDCVDVAEICPDDPNLPIVETVPCEALAGR